MMQLTRMTTKRTKRREMMLWIALKVGPSSSIHTSLDFHT